MTKSNLFGTKKAAEKALENRMKESPIIYRSDRIFYIAPGKHFVGTYYEYKMYMNI